MGERECSFIQLRIPRNEGGKAKKGRKEKRKGGAEEKGMMEEEGEGGEKEGIQIRTSGDLK